MSDLVDDLRWAVAQWRTRPELLVVEVALTIPVLAMGFVLTDDEPAMGMVLLVGIAQLVFSLPGLGWLGAQRVVYARAVTHPDEVGATGTALVRATASQMGRFLVLGITVGVVMFPLLLGTATTSVATLGGFLAMLGILGVEVALTFVTPVLALDDGRVRVALQAGWRLLRQHWRRAEWHAVLPPVLLGVHTYADLPEPVEATITLLLLPVLVAVRGAVVRLYLRVDRQEALTAATAGMDDR